MNERKAFTIYQPWVVGLSRGRYYLMAFEDKEEAQTVLDSYIMNTFDATSLSDSGVDNIIVLKSLLPEGKK